MKIFSSHNLISYILAFVLLGLNSVSEIRAEEAAENLTSTHDLLVTNATLKIELDAPQKSVNFVLSATIPNSSRHQFTNNPIDNICSASLGNELNIKSNLFNEPDEPISVCNILRSKNSGLASNDNMVRKLDSTHLTVSRTIEKIDGWGTLQLKKGFSIGADNLEIQIKTKSKDSIVSVNTMPTSVGGGVISYRLNKGSQVKDFNVNFLAVDNDGNPQPPDTKSPKSWFGKGNSIALLQTGIPEAVLFSFILVFVFRKAQQVHPLPVEIAADDALGWLMPTLFFLFFARITYLGMFGRDDFIEIFDPFDWADMNFFLFQEIRSLNYIFLMSVLLCAFWLISLILEKVFGSTIGIGRIIGIIAVASLSSFALHLILSGLALTEPSLPWLGFEGPALLVSVTLVGLGLMLAQDKFEFPKNWVLPATFLISFTILFPADTVLKSNYEVLIAENTLYWAAFVSTRLATYLFLAALALIALKTTQSDSIDKLTKSWWVLLLLSLALASFNIQSLPNFLGTGAVFLIGQRLMFKDISGRSGDELTVSSEAHRFSFYVGASSAAIYLLQYVFSDQPASRGLSLPLLGLAQTGRAFAIGYIAGLLLSTGRNLMHGDSMTLKALFISIYILALNVSSNVTIMENRTEFIGSISNNLAIVSALVLSAVFFYDLPNKDRKEKVESPKDLFKGTTLAYFVPIVSSLAAAIVTGLSPILVEEVGAAFGDMLQNALKFDSDKS